MKQAVQLQKKMQAESFHLRHELERFNSQVKYVERLLELFPDKKKQFSKLVKDAVAKVENLKELSNLDRLKEAVGEAEKAMAPLAKFAKSFTIHCVGHAHIDMNWMWSWPETIATTNDTFATVLKLMKEYPEFTFSQSQASVYKIIADYNPEMLKQIKARVKEGRWETTASHWVEGNKNMVNGETLTRQVLYTRQYMKKLFDLNPEDVIIDWAPDTFGHNAMVPAYLNKGGVKYTYMHRPGRYGEKRPKAFWWKCKDGSKVLVYNDKGMPNGYNGRISSEIASHLLDFISKSKASNFMYVYGIGDHGGGPTRCDLNKIIDMSQWPIFPTIKFSTANTFFKELEKEAQNLTVWEGELNFEFTGCYTSQAQIKKANQYSENRLYDAELAAVLAWKTTKISYPYEQLEKSWQDCLFNHFHDILPGSGVRDTRHYSMGLFQEIMANTSMIETNSLRQMAAAVDTSSAASDINSDHPPTFYKDAFGAGVGIWAVSGNMSVAEQSTGCGNRPFILYNSTASKRNEVVEVAIWDNPIPEDNRKLKDRHFAVKTPNGKLLPTQAIDEGHLWGHNYVKLAFPVELSALSYGLYTIIEEEDALPVKSSLKMLQVLEGGYFVSNERSSVYGGENDQILLEINPKTGGILRLHDKKSKIDIISPEQQVPMLEYALERPRHGSAWMIDYADHAEAPEIRKISCTATGPYKIAVQVEARHRQSKFTVTYEIQENNPKVNINVKTTWLEPGSPEIGCPSLRMPFAVNLEAAKAKYEIAFGAVERDLNSDQEVPALNWANVSGMQNKKQAGCLLLNDCKYGHALDKNVLRISLLRSTYEPDPNPDLGAHEINLALVPYSEKMSDAEASRIGLNFNRPIKTVGTDVHKGKLPATDKMIEISADNVVFSGIKKAEQGNALILRLYETEGQNKDVTISLSEKVFGKIKSVTAVDFMERPIDGKKVVCKAESVKVAVKKYEIISLKVNF